MSCYPVPFTRVQPFGVLSLDFVVGVASTSVFSGVFQGVRIDGPFKIDGQVAGCGRHRGGGLRSEATPTCLLWFDILTWTPLEYWQGVY